MMQYFGQVEWPIMSCIILEAVVLCLGTVEATASTTVDMFSVCVWPHMENHKKM